MRRRHDAFQLVHDYEHMGLNNAYLSKMQHERALRYNDNHVNEHHHVAAAFTVLLKPHPPSPLSLFLSLSPTLAQISPATIRCCSSLSATSSKRCPRRSLRPSAGSEP